MSDSYLMLKKDFDGLRFRPCPSQTPKQNTLPEFKN